MLLPTALNTGFKLIAPVEPQHMNGSAYAGKSKLTVLLRPTDRECPQQA
jgi:hypothetical protein